MSLIITMTFVAGYAQSRYDQCKPFGFCTVSSRTDSNETFAITGGGGYVLEKDGRVTDGNGNTVDAGKVKVLTAEDVRTDDDIKNTIVSYDVVVLDGSKGDFTISSMIELHGIENKTILGTNNARLCTRWYVTREIHDLIEAAGATTASTSGGGGTLSNGTRVREEAEYLTRQCLINMMNDETEAYRSAGIFGITGRNIILRNISFVGPGSIDVGGSDLLSVRRTTHLWVDHCSFQDGMDGNFDITGSSDFITVSWCTFSYTERSFMHQNTNLVGANDREPVGFLNTTYAYNLWGKGCKQRMPMARVGKIHMLNNMYDCPGNNVCINPRANSEFLIEGNYFAPSLSQSSQLININPAAIGCTIGEGNVASAPLPDSTPATVSVPYTYSVQNAKTMMKEIKRHAGATLRR